MLSYTVICFYTIVCQQNSQGQNTLNLTKQSTLIETMCQCFQSWLSERPSLHTLDISLLKHTRFKYFTQNLQHLIKFRHFNALLTWLSTYKQFIIWSILTLKVSWSHSVFCRLKCGSRKFKSAPWFLRQADNGPHNSPQRRRKYLQWDLHFGDICQVE